MGALKDSQMLSRFAVETVPVIRNRLRVGAFSTGYRLRNVCLFRKTRTKNTIYNFHYMVSTSPLLNHTQEKRATRFHGRRLLLGLVCIPSIGKRFRTV